MKNTYEINNKIVTIHIRQRNGSCFETYIDEEDLEKILASGLSWHVKYNTTVKKYYVRSTKYKGMINGKPKYETILLHRFILDFPKGVVDHKDYNTLNNCKDNLRITNQSGNMKNRSGLNKNNTTGYRNVSYLESIGKYVFQLQVNRKNTMLGEFDDVDEAGAFAKKMREKYYKGFVNQ